MQGECTLPLPWRRRHAKRMNEGFFYKRMGQPILELLRQGATPEKLALSVALGVALGVFPVLGTTTALCALAALALRLNLPAIQLVNYFVYPAQIAVLIPFFRLGEWLFRAPRLPLSISQTLLTVRADYWHAMSMLFTTTWHAVAAWCLVAPAVVAMMYAPLVVMLKRAMKERRA